MQDNQNKVVIVTGGIQSIGLGTSIFIIPLTNKK